MAEADFRICRRLLHSSLPIALAMSLQPDFARGQQLAQAAGAASAEKPAGQESAQRGQRVARDIKYGDWRKVCFKVPATPTVCRTTISGTFETGQSAVRIDLIEKQGEAAARLQLFLPVGLYLQAGAKLTVDQAAPHRVPYVWCLTNTCIAGDRADAGLVKDMDGGRTLLLEVVDTSLLTVSTTLPLDQFGKVHNGPPSQTFEQSVDE